MLSTPDSKYSDLNTLKWWAGRLIGYWSRSSKKGLACPTPKYTSDAYKFFWTEGIWVLEIPYLPQSRTQFCSPRATQTFSSQRELSTTPRLCHKLSHLPLILPRAPLIFPKCRVPFQKPPLSLPFSPKLGMWTQILTIPLLLITGCYLSLGTYNCGCDC